MAEKNIQRETPAVGDRPANAGYSATGHPSFAQLMALARGGVHRGIPRDALRMARPKSDCPGRMTEIIVDSDVLSFLFKNHPIGQLYDADVAGRAAGVSFIS